MPSSIRWGLCCLVVDAPIAFRSATHRYVWGLASQDRQRYLSGVALHNAAALGDVLDYCRRLDIRAFRVTSQLFPLATHPLSGYGLDALLPGGLSLEEATDWALATWDRREPYFHLSSPRAGWSAGDPRPHADLVDPADVPAYWLGLGIPLTIDVEAKAKERAVVALRRAVG